MPSTSKHWLQFANSILLLRHKRRRQRNCFQWRCCPSMLKASYNIRKGVQSFSRILGHEWDWIMKPPTDMAYFSSKNCLLVFFHNTSRLSKRGWSLYRAGEIDWSSILWWISGLESMQLHVIKTRPEIRIWEFHCYVHFVHNLWACDLRVFWLKEQSFPGGSRSSCSREPRFLSETSGAHSRLAFPPKVLSRDSCMAYFPMPLLSQEKSFLKDVSWVTMQDFLSSQGQGLGEFHDIHKLTMFADYRVPVVLRELGILHYSPQLAEKVTNLDPCRQTSAQFVCYQCAKSASPFSEVQLAKRLRSEASMAIIFQCFCLPPIRTLKFDTFKKHYCLSNMRSQILTTLHSRRLNSAARKVWPMITALEAQSSNEAFSW